jgi:hypothetical protein
MGVCPILFFRKEHEVSQRNSAEQYFITVEEFINKIFMYPELMQQHITFMRNFPDYEFFNVAGILLQKHNSTFIKSKYAWDEYFEKEVYIKKGAKSIRTAVPYIQDGLLEFKLIPCYDITDLSNIDKEKKCIVTPIQRVFDKHGNIEKINSLFALKNTNLNNFIKKKVEEIEFFKKQDQNTQDIIMQYILYSLNIDISEISPLSTSDALLTYSFINNVIKLLPDWIEEELIRIEEREMEIKERENLLKSVNRSVGYRILDAKKKYFQRINNVGKQTIIDEEIIYDEEEIPIPLESEVY